MKNTSFLLLLFSLFTFTSCDLIGGIFKAGMWSGILVVVGLIALVIWFLARAGKSKG